MEVTTSLKLLVIHARGIPLSTRRCSVSAITCLPHSGTCMVYGSSSEFGIFFSTKAMMSGCTAFTGVAAALLVFGPVMPNPERVPEL